MLRRIILCLFLLSFTSVFAQSPADDLRPLLNNIRSMQALFSQTMTDKNAKQVQRSSGEMAMQRPGKFRWIIRKPTPQTIVTDGTKLWVYEPDLEQVTIHLLNKNTSDSPAQLLSNTSVSLEKNYQVTRQTMKDSALDWFILKPTHPQSVFTAIKLGFQHSVIREMILQDQIGHTTAIEFYDVKLNPSLANSLFVFRIPKNIDVIDETRQRR